MLLKVIISSRKEKPFAHKLLSNQNRRQKVVNISNPKGFAGGFAFVRGDFTFVQGSLIFKLDKNSTNL